jgi:cation diffusion facilitator CzcD-associated flavoprotein CzcO
MSPSRREIDCEVVIVGAGPYGLGAAAHLKAAHVDFRIFGDPMSFWRDHMPAGMKLRSGWSETHLSDPHRRFTLDAYTQHRGIKQPDLLPLEEFVAYTDWFRSHAVPDIDPRKVTRINADKGSFRLDLSDGSSMRAARVVIATGLANQEFRPEEFDGLPRDLVTHVVEHADLSKFRGKRVGVVGRGQSACENAAILSQHGADVELITRGEILWLGLTKKPTLQANPLFKRFRKMIAAPTGVGPFPVSWLNEFPAFLRQLPQAARDAVNTASLGPGCTGWVKPHFEKVRVRSGVRVVGSRAVGKEVHVAFQCDVGTYDHVMLGTGYHIDISRLGLFGPEMLRAIRRVDGSPRLRGGFESSVPGLHFLGANAVKSYGPLMRFIAGSGYAARLLTREIAGGRVPVGVRKSATRLAKPSQVASR